MKAFITPTYTFTPGAAGVGTVDLSAISSFDIKRLIAVINQTRGVVIYSTADVSLKYVSEASGIVTLSADTSTHSSADNLQIIYDSVDDFATSAKQDLAKAVLDSLKANSDSMVSKDFATGAKQDAIKALFPTSIGQKTLAGSLSVGIASDQPSLPVSVESLLQSSLTAGSLNADLIPSVDVSKYAYVSLQVTGTWAGVLSVQGSNDNSTWSAVNLQALTSGSSGVTSTISINTLAVAPIFFKYLRVRMTSYTSGTANGAAYFSATGPDSLGADTVLQAGTWSVNTTASSVTGTITSAQVTVGTTAVRATVAGTAPNSQRKYLCIKPSKNNTGAIYFGPSTVTTSSGLEIIGPDYREFNFDAGDFYLISDTAGQTVEIIEKA